MRSRLRRKAFESIGVTAAVAALVVAPMIGTSLSSASAAAPPVVVVSANFDDGTLGQLQQSGNPTFGYVAEGAGLALSVSGRANGWDAVSSAEGVLEAGTEYTFSARVRLPAGSAPTAAHFTGFNGGADADAVYTWVGDTPVTADAWTTVTGTYTLPARSVPAKSKVTLEVGGAAPWPAFLLDDVVVSRAASGPAPVDPPAPVTVLSSDFESGIAPWAGRGGTAAATTTARTGNGAMLVAGRTQNWHGAQTSINTLLAEGGTYTFSAWVRLVAGTAPTTVKMTVADSASTYPTVAPAVEVTDAAWVLLEGTWQRPAGVTGDLYLEAADATASFLVDDITIVGPPVAAAPGDGWVPDLEGFVLGGAVGPTTTPVVAARPAAGATATAALTFDDGPNGAATGELLDFLAANDVVATFCVIGQNVQAPGGADLLRRIVAEGHTLCNHGTGYADMGGWSKADVETDLKANLAIIRGALGDPDAPVPYFRAPNGSWGQTAAVAVALGMQPLAVTSTIADWETQDVATLTANLRTSMRDGQVVLVHDGGGDRAGSVAAARTVIAERLAAGWVFTLPTGGADGSWVPSRSIDADFEDSTLQGWSGRDNGSGAPTVAVVSPGRDSQYAARVSDRVSQGQGLQHTVAGIFEPGATYDVSAWIKFEGTPGDVSLSAHVETAGSSSYPNLVAFPGMSTDWVEVTGTFTMPSYTTAAEVYFETAWAGGAAGNTSTFLLDDLRFTQRPDPVVQDLPSLQGAIDVPFGVAGDSRETFRSAAQLLTRHFSQVTAENSMKPEAWYVGREFVPSADADALMDFAAAQDLRVYGHVLVWHAQTPAWFFQDDAGKPLPVNAASAEIVRENMRTHIDAIAKHMATRYGKFGSSTNPLVAWDVANEVVSDDAAASSGGLRTSSWYTYLGEGFLDDAFRFADEAFNGTYAAPGTSRPVTLFINDYNSELPGKQDRYHDLVERLVDRGVPIDGVGHQFHVSLSLPVTALGDTLERFSDLGLQQAVTELDVTTGTPLTEALLVEQGYYYRDAFRAFRRYADQLFSVTVWGLYDTRSWRYSSGAPLVFDEGMQAKPAYHGIMDGRLPARIRSGTVFAGDVALDAGATSHVMWSQLPLHDVDGAARFQARWAPDHLTVHVRVQDRFDALELQVGGTTYGFSRTGTGDVPGVVTATADGWTAVVRVPVAGTEGGTVDFDLRVVDGSDVVGWNTPGVLGVLSLVEPLSTVEVVEAAAAPVVDGDVDDVWASATSVSTGTQVEGTPGATATVRTLWRGSTLYVLADVVDATPDTSSSNPYERDSVEIFLDAGNVKNASYRYDDMQVRIDADGDVTFGTGDEPFQAARVVSEVAETATGYRVEAAVGLLDQYSGPGTFHGLDLQVNDGSGGRRTSVRTWADPTGRAHLTPQRWGVAQLVGAATPPVQDGPALELSLPAVTAGGTVTVDLAGFPAGDTVTVALDAGTTVLGSVVVGRDGSASLTVTVPRTTAAGTYRLVASVGSVVLAEGVLTVLAAPTDGAVPVTPGAAVPGTPATRPAGGTLATTGTGLGLGLMGLLAVATGSVLLVVRRRDRLGREVARPTRG
ncbi:endo-1,4-beta-xylanase [Cellulomonas sp. zg-ZUI22]|uniref:Beta-xylanase n=2 Tax=Cellulomonas wangleii TaxID=2816956 RepID=A0ABX8D921_9CELL|nr:MULTISPECIES: endo-1,4-beta-xylanase [Cellulomonas]MBO0901337.1 endo-1,4-beta-xylanase [Cellulomonas sp. zg-ZUI22]QVI62966.1 endo-1,4-beta-xylanase [Cellulomonas wangleii]